MKLWLGNKSPSGYVYDFNVNNGKENKKVDGTLGERVVRKFTS